MARMPTLELLEEVARGAVPPPPGERDRERIAAARSVIDGALAEGTAVYGVTTGFGQLASVRIPPEDAAQLQVNLVRSHAVGAGPPLPADVVRGMLLLLARVAAPRPLGRASSRSSTCSTRCSSATWSR